MSGDGRGDVFDRRILSEIHGSNFVFRGIEVTPRYTLWVSLWVYGQVTYILCIMPVFSVKSSVFAWSIIRWWVRDGCGYWYVFQQCRWWRWGW